MKILDLLRAQLALLLRSRRPTLVVVFLIAAAQGVAMAAFGVILGITVSTSGADMHVGYSRLPQFQDYLHPEVGRAGVGLMAVWGIMVIVAFFWPYGVWSQESPARRSYHWSLPVDRPLHDLLRVGAGGLLLFAVTGAASLATLAAAVVTGHAGGLGAISGWTWTAWMLGPLLPYLLVSIFTVRFNAPAAVFWGGLGVAATAMTMTTAAGWPGPSRFVATLLEGKLGFVQALGGPVLALWKKAPFEAEAEWLVAWLLWATAFKLLLALAAKLPRR